MYGRLYCRSIIASALSPLNRSQDIFRYELKASGPCTFLFQLREFFAVQLNPSGLGVVKSVPGHAAVDL